MDTRSQIIVLALLLVVAAVVFRNFFWPRIRIARIQQRPFPDAWQRILQKRLPFVLKLPDEQFEQLKLLIKVFLNDKEFYGCAGQEIDDDVRVTIAAQACLMLLNQGRVPYPDLQSILVYPSTFVATRDVANEHGFVSTDHIALLGESWSQGKPVRDQAVCGKTDCLFPGRDKIPIVSDIVERAAVTTNLLVQEKGACRDIENGPGVIHCRRYMKQVAGVHGGMGKVQADRGEVLLVPDLDGLDAAAAVAACQRAHKVGQVSRIVGRSAHT